MQGIKFASLQLNKLSSNHQKWYTPPRHLKLISTLQCVTCRAPSFITRTPSLLHPPCLPRRTTYTCCQCATRQFNTLKDFAELESQVLYDITQATSKSTHKKYHCRSVLNCDHTICKDCISDKEDQFQMVRCWSCEGTTSLWGLCVSGRKMCWECGWRLCDGTSVVYWDPGEETCIFDKRGKCWVVGCGRFGGPKTADGEEGARAGRM